MLRSIRESANLRLRMASMETVRTWGLRLLGWALLALAMLLLCRAQLAPMSAPFAMAFLSAALLAGKNAGAMLVGCMLGAINGSLRDFNLLLPIGAAIILGGSITWDLCRPGVSGRRSARNPAPRMQARSPNQRMLTVCSALAGAGALIPGLVDAGGETWPSIQALASALAAVAAAPFLRAALSWRPERRFLMPEERIGLWLLTGALTAGLAAFSMPTALCAGGVATLILYPSGALAGTAMGLALLMMGGDARLATTLCAGGMASELCADTSRWVRGGASWAAMLVSGVFLKIPMDCLAAAGAAALIALLLPEKWTTALTAWARPPQAACDPGRLTARMLKRSTERLRALSAAFGDLAEGYLAPCEIPDEQTLMGELRARLCEGCAGYAGCWMGGDNAGARFLCDLIAEAVVWSGGDMHAPLFESEMPPDALRRCRRGRVIPERAQGLLEEFARDRRLALKRGAENRLISAQFLQAQRLLSGLATEAVRPARLRDRQAARAAAALERAGIEVGEVIALDSGGVEVIATLKDGRWTPGMAREGAAQLARTFDRAYAPGEPGGRELRFLRRPRLRAETGAVCMSREAGVPSGDSHMIRMLDDERLLILISDGMGSGEAAARESAGAVRLLGRFLAAGADKALAIETVNALLMNRSREDMFATVDMLVLDLSTGVAEFSKLAACPTMIVRGEEVQCVHGGRLPLGILEKVQPAVARVQLMPGDIILMASDGVMDAAEEAGLETLLQRETCGMTALAERVLAAVEPVVSATGRRDDMTAVCVRIAERRQSTPARFAAGA